MGGMSQLQQWLDPVAFLASSSGLLAASQIQLWWVAMLLALWAGHWRRSLMPQGQILGGTDDNSGGF
jgi:hypothetical protein